MTKQKLAEQTSDAMSLPLADVTGVINNFLENIKNSVSNADPVFIRGFGTFAIVKRAAKTGRNISAGTQVHVPEQNVVKFKPSREFKAPKL